MPLRFRRWNIIFGFPVFKMYQLLFTDGYTFHALEFNPENSIHLKTTQKLLLTIWNKLINIFNQFYDIYTTDINNLKYNNCNLLKTIP